MLLTLRTITLTLALALAPFNLIQCTQDAPSSEQTVEMSKKQKDTLAFETRLVTIGGSCIGLCIIALGIKKIIHGDEIQYSIRHPFASLLKTIELNEVMPKLKDADETIKFSFLKLLFLNTPSYTVTRTKPAILSGIWHVFVGSSIIKWMKSLSSTDETKVASDKQKSEEPASGS